MKEEVYMSSMEYDVNIDYIIKTLMKASSWGQNADLKFLVKNLGNEYDELLDGIRREDKENSFEEAADVLMLVLCILNKLAPNEENYISKLFELITRKLHRRYEHVFAQINDKGLTIDIDEENRIWENAKTEERKNALIYCPNKNCDYYGDILDSNISKQETFLRCNYCGHVFALDSKCLLLGEARTQRKYYLSVIEQYLQSFCGGSEIATKEFFESESKSFRMLSKYILNCEDKTNIFVQYLIKKYMFKETDIIRFILQIKTINENNPLPLKSSAVKLIGFADSFVQPSKAIFNRKPREIKQLKSIAGQTQFKILKRVEKIIEFEARGWNKQLATKYLLLYDEVRIIECMAIVHFQDDIISDLTIELSNMYGCPVGCAFCASGALTEEPLYLTAIDFIKQLSTCLYDTGYNPDDFERFYISFAGIGEPSLVNVEILKSMKVIEAFYPHVQYNVATLGIDTACFSVWKESVNTIRTIQIPLYSISINKIKEIVGSISLDYELKSVIRAALEYKVSHPLCKVKLNYIVICDYNDSDEDVIKFTSYLGEFKDVLDIKISYLNKTIPSSKRGLASPSRLRMKQIEKMLRESGFSCYVFGTEQNSELGCGQLVQGAM